MRKLSLLAVLLVVPLFLTACTKDQKEIPVNEDETGNIQTEPQQNAESPADSEESNVITSLTDAIFQSIGVKCVYTDEEGEETLAYIKGDKIYVESLSGEDKEQGLKGIIRDEKMYIWSKDSTEGFFFNLTESSDSDDGVSMGDTQIRSSQDVINKIQNNNHTCTKENVEAKMFELPNGIEFKEFSWE